MAGSTELLYILFDTWPIEMGLDSVVCLVQQADPELVALSHTSMTEEEAQDHSVCYFKRTGVLMHKWRPPSAPAADSWI